MQTGRLNAEEQVRRLTAENEAKAKRIEVLILDYEQMKNELMENSAIKDQYIDSLTNKVFALNEKMNLQKESLQETSFTLDFEKQRLTSTIEAKDKSIRQLQSEINRMEEEIQSKTSAIEQKNFEIRTLNDKITLTEQNLKASDGKLTGLQEQLNRIKAETEKMKQQITEKDATILKLENNVKLLKSELGK